MGDEEVVALFSGGVLNKDVQGVVGFPIVSVVYARVEVEFGFGGGVVEIVYDGDGY